MTFDQSDDVAVLRSAEQVTFPVARHSPVFYGSRPFSNRNRVCDLAALLCCMPRATDWSPRPQMQQELLFQYAAGLHIKAAIDGLVRHLSVLSPWMRPLQPARDLLGRPILFQLRRNSLPQLVMHRQLTRLRTQRLFPCALVGGRGAVRAGPAIADNLPANGRWRSPQHDRHRPHRPARHKATGNLFALG